MLFISVFDVFSPLIIDRRHSIKFEYIIGLFIILHCMRRV